jgi:hypothetical protein
LNFPQERQRGSTKSSKYRGVSWYNSRNKWKAEIYYDGKRHRLGSFEDEEEAAKAYDRARGCTREGTLSRIFLHNQLSAKLEINGRGCGEKHESRSGT